MLVDYIYEKYEFFESKSLGVDSFAKLNSLLEKLFSIMFRYFNNNDIDLDEFKNLRNALKNQNILKIFFRALYYEIKSKGNLSDKFNFYFGALFDFLKEIFLEDGRYLTIFKTNFIDSLLLDYQYARKLNSLNFRYFADENINIIEKKEKEYEEEEKNENEKENLNILNQLIKLFSDLYALIKDEIFFCDLSKCLRSFFNDYNIDLDPINIGNKKKINKKSKKLINNQNEKVNENANENKNLNENKNQFLKKKIKREKTSTKTKINKEPDYIKSNIKNNKKDNKKKDINIFKNVESKGQSENKRSNRRAKPTIKLESNNKEKTLKLKRIKKISKDKNNSSVSIQINSASPIKNDLSVKKVNKNKTGKTDNLQKESELSFSTPTKRSTTKVLSRVQSPVLSDSKSKNIIKNSVSPKVKNLILPRVSPRKHFSSPSNSKENSSTKIKINSSASPNRNQNKSLSSSPKEKNLCYDIIKRKSKRILGIYNSSDSNSSVSLVNSVRTPNFKKKNTDSRSSSRSFSSLDLPNSKIKSPSKFNITPIKTKKSDENSEEKATNISIKKSPTPSKIRKIKSSEKKNSTLLKRKRIKFEKTNEITVFDPKSPVKFIPKKSDHEYSENKNLNFTPKGILNKKKILIIEKTQFKQGIEKKPKLKLNHINTRSRTKSRTTK